MILRRPTAADARAMFERYAADAEVVRYMSWPRHRSIQDTYEFLRFSDAQWAHWSTGGLLAFSRADGTLLGASGVAPESSTRASTGYVFARDAWGQGYGTEALAAMVDVAAALGIRRLAAICHTSHRPSWHVMEKCGFEREGILRAHTVFPNISPDPADVYSYSRIL